MPEIEIRGGGADGGLPHLSELLDAVPPDLRRVGWTLFDLWAVGHDDRVDVGELEARSEEVAGLRVDHARLVELGTALLQVIDGLMVIPKGAAITRPDHDVRPRAAFVLQVIDSGRWHVFAENGDDLRAMRAAFPEHRPVAAGRPMVIE